MFRKMFVLVVGFLSVVVCECKAQYTTVLPLLDKGKVVSELVEVGSFSITDLVGDEVVDVEGLVFDGENDELCLSAGGVLSGVLSKEGYEVGVGLEVMGTGVGEGEDGKYIYIDVAEDLRIEMEYSSLKQLGKDVVMSVKNTLKLPIYAVGKCFIDHDLRFTEFFDIKERGNSFRVILEDEVVFNSEDYVESFEIEDVPPQIISFVRLSLDGGEYGRWVRLGGEWVLLDEGDVPIGDDDDDDDGRDCLWDYGEGVDVFIGLSIGKGSDSRRREFVPHFSSGADRFPFQGGDSFVGDYDYLAWDAFGRTSFYYTLVGENLVAFPLNATYVGDVFGRFLSGDIDSYLRGDLNLRVDSLGISGGFTNIILDNGLGFCDVTFNAGEHPLDTTSFLGNAISNNGMSGSIVGGFFGDDAEEAGGAWDLEGGGYHAGGVFAGKKQ